MSPTKGRFFEGCEAPGPEEFFETLLERPGLRMERIVSHGQSTPEGEWYDQQRAEWVILLRGQAVLRFASDAEPVRLEPGDYVNITPHCRHRVEWTDPDQPTVWLALHYDA